MRFLPPPHIQSPSFVKIHPPDLSHADMSVPTALTLTSALILTLLIFHGDYLSSSLSSGPLVISLILEQCREGLGCGLSVRSKVPPITWSPTVYPVPPYRLFPYPRIQPTLHHTVLYYLLLKKIHL